MGCPTSPATGDTVDATGTRWLPRATTCVSATLEARATSATPTRNRYEPSAPKPAEKALLELPAVTAAPPTCSHAKESGSALASLESRALSSALSPCPTTSTRAASASGAWFRTVAVTSTGSEAIPPQVATTAKRKVSALRATKVGAKASAPASFAAVPEACFQVALQVLGSGIPVTIAESLTIPGANSVAPLATSTG